MSLNKLLQHHQNNYPQGELSLFLTDEEIQGLKHETLLLEGQPLKQWTCGYCHDVHQVHVVSNKKAFIVCDSDEGVGREIVDPRQLKTWRINLSKLTEVLSQKLGLQHIPNQVADSLWYLGYLGAVESSVYLSLQVGQLDFESPNEAKAVAVLVPNDKYTQIGNIHFVPMERVISVHFMGIETDQQYLESLLASKPQDHTKIYWITQAMSGEILVNDRYVLSKPTFDELNEKIFEWLMQHSDQLIKKDQIASELRETFNQRLSKIISELGFTKTIRRLFFPKKVSDKGTFVFRHSVTASDLEQLHISPRQVEEHLNSLKTTSYSRV